MMYGSDFIIDDNIDKIKQSAINLKNRELKSFEDSIKFVKFWLADYYKIPSKSAVFEEYTVEDLFFEYYFLSSVETQKDSAAVVRDSAKELIEMMAKEFSPDENAAMDKIFENDVNWSLDDIK